MGDGALEGAGSGSGDGLGEWACSCEGTGLVDSAGSREREHIGFWMPGMQEVPGHLIPVPCSSYHY